MKKATVTLEEIQADHKSIGEKIALFVSQAVTEYLFPAAQIELKHGEHYAGMILGKDGESSYHLILLPEEKESINWQDATDWAKSIGGELPTRREQSLLYANLKEQFTDNWYWSSVQHAAGSGYAWVQSFGNGGQDGYRKDGSGRARAVRRLVIE
jgi:hypothetical protein